MQAVMLSIHPRRCEFIANGKEKIEVRKTKPKIEIPFKVYIYCTQYRLIDYINYGYGLNMPAGMVIGEFICDYILKDLIGEYEDVLERDGRMTRAEQKIYGQDKPLYGWHISNLKIYDKPRELNEFITLDKEAIRQCEHRFQSYYRFTEGEYIKNGFECDKDDTWCFNCKRKRLVRPPQSWCYVGEVNEIYD